MTSKPQIIVRFFARQLHRTYAMLVRCAGSSANVVQFGRACPGRSEIQPANAAANRNLQRLGVLISLAIWALAPGSEPQDRG